MGSVVGIVAPGSMGAALGARLVAGGIEVLTLLEGRSSATRERAAAAGLRAVSAEELAAADLVMSIVPPGAALEIAERFVSVVGRAHRKPLFVDCNAVSPGTVQRIAQRVQAAGLNFVDAGIIGMPPRPDSEGPNIYACGPDAARFKSLLGAQLEIRVLEAPIGAASALKMSYAGITKGLVAVGTSMLLAASRAGVEEALCTELAESQSALLSGFRRSIPGMFPKAYRWVAEMREIASFAGEDPAAAAIFEGAARLYERMTRDLGETRRESTLLGGILKRASS